MLVRGDQSLTSPLIEGTCEGFPSSPNNDHGPTTFPLNISKLSRQCHSIVHVFRQSDDQVCLSVFLIRTLACKLNPRTQRNIRSRQKEKKRAQALFFCPLLAFSKIN